MPTENIDYTDKTTGDNFTAADANDIKSAVNTNAGLQLISAPVLSGLPAVTANKAGELFWYNGTLWTYAKTGQFGTLAEGTPWPVKGYKELIARFAQSGTNVPFITFTSINELGAVTGTRNGVGDYTIDVGVPLTTDDMAMISLNDAAKIVNTSPSVDGVDIEVFDTSGSPVDEFFAQVNLRQYPPQS